MTPELIEAQWASDWTDTWKPLLMTNGAFDEVKIKAELHDLWFIYMQVSIVYERLTGGKLSKPMYYADTIIDLHEDTVEKAYTQGVADKAKELAKGDS